MHDNGCAVSMYASATAYEARPRHKACRRSVMSTPQPQRWGTRTRTHELDAGLIAHLAWGRRG